MDVYAALRITDDLSSRMLDALHFYADNNPQGSTARTNNGRGGGTHGALVRRGLVGLGVDERGRGRYFLTPKAWAYLHHMNGTVRQADADRLDLDAALAEAYPTEQPAPGAPRAQWRQQLADSRSANAYPLALGAVRQVVREMPQADALRVRLIEGSPEAILTRDDLHALAYSGHTTADAVTRVRAAVAAHVRHGEREVHVMFPARGMRPALYLADVMALLNGWEITQADANRAAYCAGTDGQITAETPAPVAAQAPAEPFSLDALIDTVICPACHVAAGARCITRAGKPARAPHGRRIDALDQAAGITQHRATRRREAQARGYTSHGLDHKAEKALLTAYAARINAHAGFDTEQAVAVADAGTRQAAAEQGALIAPDSREPIVARASFRREDLDRLKAESAVERAAYRAKMDERQAADHRAHGVPVPAAVQARIEARAAEQVPAPRVIEGVIVSHTGAAQGSTPTNAAHPNVIAARAVLDGLAVATMTDHHDVTEPTDDEQHVRGYLVEPREGARVAVYWLESGRIVRRDAPIDGAALDCLADRLTRRGWNVEKMLRSSECVFAHRPSTG